VTVELDDMKLAWQAMDRQLERQQTLGALLYVENRLDKLRHGLRPLLWGQVAQIAIGVWATWLAATFWVPRVGVTHFLVWGLLVHVLGIAMIVSGVRNIYLIRCIDYAAPVLDIQRRLAALRTWRVRVEGPVFAVIGAFVWVPLLLIQLARSGIDPQVVMPALVSHLMLVGAMSLGLVVMGYGLILYMGRRRWVEDNFAGGSVQRAESILEDVARFSQE
jgi:hypothetical protein